MGFVGSVVPLWRIWQRIVEMGDAAPTVIAPEVTAVQARVAALRGLTKAGLAAKLMKLGETVDADEFTKNELVEKVLSHEGTWVEASYTVG